MRISSELGDRAYDPTVRRDLHVLVDDHLFDGDFGVYPLTADTDEGVVRYVRDDGRGEIMLLREIVRPEHAAAVPAAFAVFERRGVVRICTREIVKIRPLNEATVTQVFYRDYAPPTSD